MSGLTRTTLWLLGTLMIILHSAALAVAASDHCMDPRQNTIELNLPRIFATRQDAIHIWGRRNVGKISGEEGLRAGVRVRYPKGSANPANESLPRGGAGFELYFANRPERGCLTYRVRFAPDFMFAKGGKLPGLFGGSAPRGCTSSESDGFTARLMWRTGGSGELYLYAPAQSTRCGESIGRGLWTFRAGQWITIAEQVTLNHVGMSDGSIRIWIDDREVLDQQGLALRSTRTTQIDGVLFSTFFGGNDQSWASPQDQWADFADFSFQALPPREAP